MIPYNIVLLYHNGIIQTNSSPPLILRSTIKCNKIKHFTHTGTNTVSIIVFKFGSRKIGGGMGEHVITDKMVISGKQDFTNDIALIAIVLKSTFRPKVIET